MDLKWWWPLLAVAFGLLAAWQAWRTGNWRGAARAWTILAMVFTAVSLWLHRGS